MQRFIRRGTLAGPAPLRPLSTQNRLTLSYDLHEPSKAAAGLVAPIIFLHGLFGSKKNNRSISKWVNPPWTDPVFLTHFQSTRTWSWKTRLCIGKGTTRKTWPRYWWWCQDLRNHGESPHDWHHDYVHMADDVAGFIDQHDLRQPTIIGHSMWVKDH